MPLLLEVTIRSTALWLIAWLLLKLLRVRDAHAEKFVWTVVALASLAMPLLMRAVALPLPRSASVIVPAGAISARLLGGISHPELGSTLLSIYLIVSGLLLLRFLARLYRSFRLYHRARRPVEMVFANLNVRLSSDIRTPCTLGSTILLPVAFESWSPVARAAAIAHECAHVLHRDCYRMWLATLYQCAFWFSPFPWLLRRRLALLAEFTSDQEVLLGIKDPATYARILVQLAADLPPADVALAMSVRAHLATRVNRIMEGNMNSLRLSRGRKFALAGASLIATVLCGGCASGPHVLSSAEDPKVTWVSGAPLSQFYPAELVKRHVEGQVVVRLTVDRVGQVTHASVVNEKPAGVGLGEAAVHAARTFRFNNTLSEPVIKTMQVKFALKD